MEPVPETSPKFWKKVAFWQKNVTIPSKLFHLPVMFVERIPKGGLLF